MKRTLATALLSLTLSGCWASSTPHAPGSGPQSDLQRARARWAEKGSDDYRLVFFLGCFCSAGRYEVIVGDGAVRSVRALDAEPRHVPAAARPEYSVEELFHEAGRSDYDSVQVDYDEEYGFPRRLVVDADEHAIDDEFSVTVLSYAPLGT